MLKSLRQFIHASFETKFFALTWFVYMFMIVATTVYCYARLDFNRSYPIQTKTEKQP